VKKRRRWRRKREGEVEMVEVKEEEKWRK